jgi:PhoPQ-activated pathogenicity-related protein
MMLINILKTCGDSNPGQTMLRIVPNDSGKTANIGTVVQRKKLKTTIKRLCSRPTLYKKCRFLLLLSTLNI